MGDGCIENWMETSYAGLSFYNPQWKYLKLAFEFEHRGLGRLIFGFRTKDEDGVKREDVKDWEKVQKTIPQKMSIINVGFGRILMKINIGIMPLG